MYLKGKSQTFQDVQYTEPLLLKDNAALLFRDTLPFIFRSNAASKNGH